MRDAIEHAPHVATIGSWYAGDDDDIVTQAT
jgi:hypothetical protein